MSIKNILKLLRLNKIFVFSCIFHIKVIYQ